MINMTTTVTGVVVNGFTAPTYTLSPDSNPTPNSRQSYVSGLGGTQTNVRKHAASDPFTWSSAKPLRLAFPPRPNPLTGAIGKAERNKYEHVVRKGTVSVVGQNPQISELRLVEYIVAGAEVNDVPNLAAMYSFMIGMLTDRRAELLLGKQEGSN